MTRRYTEFKKGAAQLNVNVFTDAVGSRIILTYKDEAKETPVPPLAAVASLPIKGGGAGRAAASEATATPVGTTPIDVTSNKGSATVNYAGKQYTFPQRGLLPDQEPRQRSHDGRVFRQAHSFQQDAIADLDEGRLLVWRLV